MNKEEFLYISPITDFGFKKCFRDEIVMKGFLTALFEYAGVTLNIVSLTYLNNESDGEKEKSRRVIYDLKCKLDTGEEFIIEMQNEKQSFLDKRITYYMARGISNQGDIIKQKGDTITKKEKKKWNYDIKKVVGIFLLNFKIPGEERHKVSRNCIVNMNSRKKEISNEYLEYWKIQLPYYRKRKMNPENCKTELEYWLYNIANMDKMRNKVQFMDKTPALSRLGEVARYHVLSRVEQEKYMKEYDDYVVLKDAMNVKYQEGAEKGEQRGEQRGFKKGMAEGIAKGMAQGKAEGERDAKIETARQMKADGMAIALIIKYTGLSAEDIDKL
ncbi:MAG: Rpn family recombination-promoting nuclease/putative transposase [Bacteroidales bacterium]|nr:Rpn family recombination-promoting nuclease/putative transposase [Bacteroidales bacterium]